MLIITRKIVLSGGEFPIDYECPLLNFEELPVEHRVNPDGPPYVIRTIGYKSGNSYRCNADWFKFKGLYAALEYQDSEMNKLVYDRHIHPGKLYTLIPYSTDQVCVEISGSPIGPFPLSTFDAPEIQRYMKLLILNEK